MKKYLLITIFLLASGSYLCAAANTDSLCIATYNLRRANNNPGEEWSTRRELLTKCVSSIAPDIMGTQEGLFSQLCDIAKDLPELDWVGLGRQGGSRDEFAAIFFRKDRLELLEYDHFWLSDTPELIGSATWGNIYRRITTWARFRDRRTEQQFYIWNTHLDHEVHNAQVKGANLIRERITKLNPKIPVILMGDFNLDVTSKEVYQMLIDKGGFTDTWLAASTRKGGSRGTFNDFGAFSSGSQRIDWILFRGNISTESVEVVETTYDGRYPSDHFPVVAKLQLN